MNTKGCRCHPGLADMAGQKVGTQPLSWAPGHLGPGSSLWFACHSLRLKTEVQNNLNPVKLLPCNQEWGPHASCHSLLFGRQPAACMPLSMHHQEKGKAWCDGRLPSTRSPSWLECLL